MLKSILFVCLGNICRSPAADGYLRYLIQKENLNLVVDSSGTSTFHNGEAPHAAMIKVAQSRGIHIGSLKSRKLVVNDFRQFDFIIAMDEQNFIDIKAMAPSNNKAKLFKLLDFCGLENKSVPDPYYGGATGFIQCLDIVEQGVDGFVKYLKDEKAI